MTLTEIINAVTGLITDYAVYIAAGAVVGLGVTLLRRLVKGVR